MALLMLGTPGVADPGDYTSSDTDLRLCFSSHRSVRITAIGNGRSWVEIPSADSLGMRLESYSWTAVTELTIGMRVTRGNNDGDDEVAIVNAIDALLGNDVFSVRVKNNGRIKIKQAFDSAVAYDGDTHGSIDALPNSGDEAYIEIHYKRNAAGGAGTATFDVYVDGVLDGTNTLSTGIGWDTVAALKFGWGQATSDDNFRINWKFADMYADSTTRWGPCHVCYRPASVAGDLAEFTPNTGTNEAAVDELGGDDDTTYNEASGDNEQDALGHAGVGAPALTLHPVAFVKKTGSDVGLIEVGIRSNGTDQFSGTPGVVTTSYTRFRGLTDVQLDPDTGLAWDFNGTQDLQVTYRATRTFTLARTSGSGLLSRYEFDNGSFPFSTSDWSAPSQVTLSISSSKLRCAGTASASNRFIRNTAVSSQSEMLVYARMVRSTGAQMGVGALVSDNDPTSKDGIEASAAGGFSGGRFLIEWVANASTTIDSTGSGINNSSPQLTSVWANATDAAMRDHNNSANESGTYSPAQSGVPAVYFSTTSSINVDVEKFFSFIGRYITVTGLTPGSGQKAKLRTSGGSVLVQATESGGTATIDGIFVSAFETVHHIQITDANDVELGRSSGTTPWPGETWAATAGAEPVRVTQAGLMIMRDIGSPPDTPTITGEADGAFAVDVAGSDYEHSQGVPMDAVIWEIADDEDFTINVDSQEVANDGSDPIEFEWSGLDPATAYWFRVRYRDENLALSDWSDPIEITTATPPNTPTINGVATGPRSGEATLSDYSHPGSVPIGGVVFRIATNAGMSVGLVTVQIDYDDPTDAPTPMAYPWPDLSPSTTYWVDGAYIDEDGAQSAFATPDSFTTTAEQLPTTPSIIAAVADAVSVQLQGSLYANPFGFTHVSSDWQVDLASGNFSSPVNESLDDVSILTAENIPGLTAGTAYKARVRYRASDGSYSAWSAAYSFSTLTVPTNRPAQPAVTVIDETQDTARFIGSTYSDPQSFPHQRTRWFVTRYPLGGTFGLAYKVADFTTTTFLTDWTISGLEEGTLYHVAVRYQASDGDWSDWSPWVPFTTVGDPLGGALLQWQQPRMGEPVRGTAVSLEWTPTSFGGSTFELEYSIDLGVTWLPLADGVAASGYLWNVSALVDGVYKVRVRAVAGDETTDWSELILYVDNANLEAGGTYLFNWNADEGITDLGDWEAIWNTTNVTWSVGSANDVRFSAPGISSFESALAFLPAFEPRQVDVLGEVLIGSTGGSFPWQWFPEQCWGGIGVFAAGGIAPGIGPEDGVAATIYAVPIQAYGDCEVRGAGDGFLELAVYENGRRIKTDIRSIGRVHFVNRFNGCNKVPRYGIRLRLTTIQDLPGDRRRLRVQVSVTGRGIEAGDDGWHIQTTVDTGLDCGCAAFVARQITTTNNPYRSFTNLTVIPYEYGECLAPPQFADSIDFETCPPYVQDLTIFDDDDVTPLWGSADAYGDVLVASFSTDKNHERPWLNLVTEGAAHEVDPISGSSNISSVRVEVIDKRVVACDQKSGFLTANGADANFFSAFIGRRAVVRERLEDGTWQVIANGPILDVALLDSMSTYAFTISSMREREREVVLFDNQYRTWVAYPYGPAEGYGFLGTPFGSLALYQYPPALVATGVFNFALGDLNGVRFGTIENTEPEDTIKPTHPDLRTMGLPKLFLDQETLESRYSYSSLVLRWRYPGEDDSDWRYIENMAAFDDLTNMLLMEEVQPAVLPGDWPVVRVIAVALNAPIDQADELMPQANDEVEWQVLPKTVPNAEFPLIYEGAFGDLLRRIYDGEFSPGNPAIRYDESCMDEFEATGPFARLWKTDGEEDLKDWVEENIFQASGWLPGLNEDGYICMINTALPDGDESLVTLDEGLVMSANWSQDGSRANSVVRYEFVKEWIELLEDASPKRLVRQTEDVFVERIAIRGADLLRNRSKTLVIKPETIAALGGEVADALNIELQDDSAFLLAQERVDELIERYAFGPQIVPCRVRDTALTRGLRVGTWCIVDIDWLPNQFTLSRGGPQLALVIRRKKDPGLAWDLTLILAGGAQSGLLPPEIYDVSVAEPGSGGGGGGSGSGNDVIVGVEPPAEGAIWSFNPGSYANEAALRNDSSMFLIQFDEESSSGGAVGAFSLNASPPAGASSGKTMRYTFTRDNTPGPSGSGCKSITITRGSIRFAPMQSMWVEFRARWSSNFDTANAACPPGDHKLFFIDTVSDESDRWAIYVSSQGLQMERPRDPNGCGAGIPCGPGAQSANGGSGLVQSDIWDGNWHVFRIYIRHSTNTVSNDGAMKWWIDGQLVHSEQGFNTCKSAADGNGTERADGISFCHNQDDGPINTVMTIDWDYVEVYNANPGWT